MKPFVLVIALVTVLGCVPMAVKARRYAGDGELRICSNLLAQGYTIDFPSFAADQPHSASYKLSRIPAVGRDPFLYLRFHSGISSLDTDRIKTGVTATFEAVLMDSNGKEIQGLALSVAKAIWSQSRDLFGAYDLDKSAFHFEPEASYDFEIDGCAYK